MYGISRGCSEWQPDTCRGNILRHISLWPMFGLVRHIRTQIVPSGYWTAKQLHSWSELEFISASLNWDISRYSGVISSVSTIYYIITCSLQKLCILWNCCFKVQLPSCSPPKRQLLFRTGPPSPAKCEFWPWLGCTAMSDTSGGWLFSGVHVNSPDLKKPNNQGSNPYTGYGTIGTTCK